jgi:hypothetical protein
MNKLGVHLGDSIICRLEKDNSEFAHEFPIEFQEVLNMDTKDRKMFVLHGES